MSKERELLVDEQRDLRAQFLERLRTAVPTEDDLALAREQYREVPDDVLEAIARQQAAARPILEQYHLIADSAPTLAVARALAHKEIDAVVDIVTAMDLSDLGDVGDFDDEYTCPRCAHAWSGQPNFRTGYGNKVYVPTGKVSARTGRLRSDRYGPPVQTNPDFKFGRLWKGAKSEALPRGYGNKPIGRAIYGETWRKKRKNIYPE